LGTELANGCRSLTEGGGGFPPEGFPPAPPEGLPVPPEGGGDPSCEDFEQVPAPLGTELANGCRSLTEGGGGFPPEGFPPAPPEGLPVPPGDGGSPSCDDLDQLAEAGLPGEVVTPVKDGCVALTEAIPLP